MKDVVSGTWVVASLVWLEIGRGVTRGTVFGQDDGMGGGGGVGT